MERIENNGCESIKTETGFRGRKINHRSLKGFRHDLFCATCGIDYVGDKIEN